jgi:hypothetical protein
MRSNLHPDPFKRGSVFIILSVICCLFCSSRGFSQVENLTHAKKVILNDSLYQSGIADVNETRRKLLDSVAVLMHSNPDLSIEVDGYTDNRGSDAANLALAMLRATKVRDYLLQHHDIDTNRVIAKSMGSANPCADNNTEEGRAKNRRVELVPLTPLTNRPVIGPNDQMINQEGYFSFIQRDVSSKPPWTQLFSNAHIDQPVYELHRIRTLGDSRSIVTFNDKSEMTIGDNTLVIVYGLSAPEHHYFAKENIELTRGGLLAKLHSLNPGSRFVVNTPAASVAMNADTRTKIGVDSTDHSSVSVFNGSSGVSAVNQTVIVKEGFGTDVAKGAPPRPPRPLPAAPLFTSPLSDTVGLATAGLRFSWVPTAPRTRLEISSEAAFRSIEHSLVTPDSVLQVSLAPGTYYYRATALDSGGLESNSDLSRSLTVVDSSVFRFALQITNPATHDITVESESFTVAGEVTPGARIEINGVSVTVGSTGLFRHPVAVTRDENIVRIAAFNHDGRVLRDSVILRKPKRALLDLVFRVSPYAWMLGYRQYDHGFLAGIEGEYQLNATQAAGLMITFGDVSNKYSAPPPGGTPGNPIVVMMQLTGRNDFEIHEPYLLTGDVGVGPIIWSNQAGTQQSSFALAAGIAAKKMDGATGYMVGLRWQFIPFDRTSFDALSASQPHSMLALEFSLIFNGL